jgi:hypothetical protein
MGQRLGVKTQLLLLLRDDRLLREIAQQLA